MRSAARCGVLFACCALLVCSTLKAQAREGVMSDGEIESLRESAYIPVDRIVAYEKILDTRSSRLDALLKARRHLSFADDLHDLLDQTAAIADELNDNLDEYRANHRDIRKAVPKLQQELDRWTRSVEATPEDADDKVIRKLALDAVNDVRLQLNEMTPEMDAYFKEHPDAAKAEKDRLDHAHDPHAASPQ